VSEYIPRRGIGRWGKEGGQGKGRMAREYRAHLIF